MVSRAHPIDSRRGVAFGLVALLLGGALLLPPITTPAEAGVNIVKLLKQAIWDLVDGRPADRSLWHGAAFNPRGITPNQRMAGRAAEYAAGGPRSDEARDGILGFVRGTFMVDELMGYNDIYLASVGIALQRAVAIGDRELEQALRQWLHWWAALASLHATPGFDTYTPGGRTDPTDETARVVLELLTTGSARDPWGNPRAWRRDNLQGTYVIRHLLQQGILQPNPGLAPGNAGQALAALDGVRLPYPLRWASTSQGWFSYTPQGTAAPYQPWNHPRFAASYIRGTPHQLRYEGTLHRNHSGQVELRGGAVHASLPNGWRGSIPIPGGEVVRSVEIHQGVRVLEGPAIAAGGGSLPGPGGGTGAGTSLPEPAELGRRIVDRVLPGLGDWLDRLGRRSGS